MTPTTQTRAAVELLALAEELGAARSRLIAVLLDPEEHDATVDPFTAAAPILLTSKAEAL